MDIDQAVQLLKIAVKNNGTNDEKHIDLTLVPSAEKPVYEKALVVAQMAIKDGKITRDELFRRINLHS